MTVSHAVYPEDGTDRFTLMRSLDRETPSEPKGDSPLYVSAAQQRPPHESRESKGDCPLYFLGTVRVRLVPGTWAPPSRARTTTR
jgi:hypothetical protein